MGSISEEKTTRFFFEFLKIWNLRFACAVANLGIRSTSQGVQARMKSGKEVDEDTEAGEEWPKVQATGL